MTTRRPERIMPATPVRRPRRRRPAGPPAPVYAPGAPVVTVPLVYPFRLGRQWFRAVDLVPPAWGRVNALAVSEHLAGIDLLVAVSGLSEAALEAMRWTDAERLLEAARPLLPPDLWPSPPAEDAAPEAGAEAAAAGPPPPPHDWTDLDDDEAELPTAAPEMMADFLGV